MIKIFVVEDDMDLNRFVSSSLRNVDTTFNRRNSWPICRCVLEILSRNKQTI